MALHLVACEFQSSPGPLTGCDGDQQEHAGDTDLVSILTRPADRVRLPQKEAMYGPKQVSILTRHADRVRPPARKPRCIKTPLFQSSPGTLTGCDSTKSILLHLCNKSFNPHPAR